MAVAFAMLVGGPVILFEGEMGRGNDFFVDRTRIVISFSDLPVADGVIRSNRKNGNRPLEGRLPPDHV